MFFPLTVPSLHNSKSPPPVEKFVGNRLRNIFVHFPYFIIFVFLFLGHQHHCLWILNPWSGPHPMILPSKIMAADKWSTVKNEEKVMVLNFTDLFFFVFMMADPCCRLSTITHSQPCPTIHCRTSTTSHQPPFLPCLAKEGKKKRKKKEKNKKKWRENDLS